MDNQMSNNGQTSNNSQTNNDGQKGHSLVNWLILVVILIVVALLAALWATYTFYPTYFPFGRVPPPLHSFAGDLQFYLCGKNRDFHHKHSASDFLANHLRWDIRKDTIGIHNWIIDIFNSFSDQGSHSQSFGDLCLWLSAGRFGTICFVARSFRVCGFVRVVVS